MFDDQNQPSSAGQPNNQPSSPSSSAGPKPIPPANLPQSAEPTVMPKLSDLKDNLSAAKPVGNISSLDKGLPAGGLTLPDLPKVDKAEDIFEETEATPSLAAAPLGAVPPVMGPPRPLAALPDDLDSDFAGGGKKTWLIIVIVVIVLGLGGYYAYSRFFRGLTGQLPDMNLEDFSPSNLNQKFEEEVLNLNLGQEPEPSLNENVNADWPAEADQDTDVSASTKDSDKDGLTDEEEEGYGTDPFEPDSDGDNLFDREEVKVWHTNPLNPDSDSDGYLDGNEVEAGYNPLGPGKLLDINFEE